MAVEPCGRCRDNTLWLHGSGQWVEAPWEIPSASAYYLMDYGLYEPFELVVTL